MNATARIAAAVAGGYLLGRTKKLKLAITVGSMLAGQRISTNPRELLRQGAQLIESNPELSKLSDQVRSQLLQALRAAAVSTASAGMNQLSDTIHDRTQRLALPQDGGDQEPEDLEESDQEDQEPEDVEESDQEESEEAEDSGEEAVDEADDGESEDEESESEEEPSRKRAGRSSSASTQTGRSRTKKLPAKKPTRAPAKPSSAKKQTSKKSTTSRSSRTRKG